MLEMFAHMREYLEEDDYNCEEIKPHVPTHLTDLKNNFRESPSKADHSAT
jgi:hypothetical protein